MARFAKVVDGVVTGIVDAEDQDRAAGVIGPCADWVVAGHTYDARQDGFYAPPTNAELIAATDKAMARVSEDWIAAVAATNPTALQWIKDNRQGGLAKVNARRVLRGETEI